MSYLTCRVSSTFYFLLVLCLTSVSVHAKPSVSWSEQSLNVEVLNGTVVVKELSFVTTDAIKDLSFKIGDDCDDLDDDYCAGQPNLASFIEVVQPLPGPIVAGASISIGIVFSIPSDIPEGAYSGTLHVRDGKKTKARPLEFSLFVTHGSSDIVPEGISIATPDRIAIDPANGQLFTIDQAEVVLRDEADIHAFASRLSALGGVFSGQVPFLPFYQIRFPSVESPQVLDYLIEKLQSDADVRVATREWHSESRIDPPDDTQYEDDPWDQDHPSGRNAPWEFTNFLSAWDDVYAGKDLSTLNKINIAVVDYGFTYHTDLQDNISYSDILLQTTLVLSPLNETYSHGTSVAGVIGAVADNATGVAGGIWNTRLSFTMLDQ